MGLLDRFRRPQSVGTLNDEVNLPIKQPITEAPMSTDTIKKVTVKRVGVAYVKNASTRDNFEGPIGISFSEISNAYITDSYVRQAIDKHVDFLFKAGYDLVSKDQNSLDYVKARISGLELATGQSFEGFLRQAADELMKYHNVFIAKVRQPGSYQYPAGVTAKGVYSNKPVAAYFLLPSASITIARDETGGIKMYRQQIQGVTTSSGQQYIDIKVEDMIHIYLDKPLGKAYGIPFIWEALDDIKILRHLEELSVNMIYKNIFPLAVYTVGTENQPAQEDEIDEVKSMLGSDFTFDGGLVVPYRHSIKIEEMGSKGLDITEYLSYYKNRVFAGLGVSPTLMGEGGTASRSTADTIDQGFKDRIKSYQREFELSLQDSIIKELLLEGGIDFITNPESIVEFRFREIDLDSKIKKENHSIQLFTQNAITHPEMRRAMGLEELADADFELTYSRLITGWLEAQAAQQANDAANASGSNKDQPANKTGKKLSPGTKANKEFVEMASNNSTLNRYYNALCNDTIRIVETDLNDKDLTFWQNYDIIRLEMGMKLSIDRMKESINNLISTNYMQAIVDAKRDSKKQLTSKMNITLSTKKLEKECESRIDIFLSQLKQSLVLSIKNSDKETLKQNIQNTFNIFESKIIAMNTTEPYIAYNTSYMKTAKALGFDKVYIKTEDKCDKCNEFEYVSTDGDIIPPFHTNCKCKLIIKQEDI